MVKLAKTLSRVTQCKILLIGDFLLDTYTMGKVGRISPEAPVVVLKVEKEEQRPGGAGNVVLNMVSLGAQIVAIGRLGNDASGQMLSQCLAKEGVDVRGLVVQQNYHTPVKNRVIANHQQIVRIDHETHVGLPVALEEEIIALLPELLQEIDIIAISDYGKGFLTHRLLHHLIKEGKAREIPIIADPKGVDFSKYAGVTVLKPNLGETFAAANLLPGDSLDEAAVSILRKTGVEILMVTRSEAGISLFFQNGQRTDFPVKIREVIDVTGAGDTVLAVVAWALANRMSIEEATEIANFAAGIAIERFGCARVSLSDIAQRILEKDVHNKLFDIDHLFALVESLRGKRYTLLILSQQEGFTSTLFETIRLLRKESDSLFIFLQDEKSCEELLPILTSLNEVDFLITNQENLDQLHRLYPPEEVYVQEGELQLELR
jgi:rfaE bifunctional protein kinase chain/domain